MPPCPIGYLVAPGAFLTFTFRICSLISWCFKFDTLASRPLRILRRHRWGVCIVGIASLGFKRYIPAVHYTPFAMHWRNRSFRSSKEVSKPGLRTYFNIINFYIEKNTTVRLRSFKLNPVTVSLIYSVTSASYSRYLIMVISTDVFLKSYHKYSSNMTKFAHKNWLFLNIKNTKIHIWSYSRSLTRSAFASFFFTSLFGPLLVRGDIFVILTHIQCQLLVEVQLNLIYQIPAAWAWSTRSFAWQNW